MFVIYVMMTLLPVVRGKNFNVGFFLGIHEGDVPQTPHMKTSVECYTFIPVL